jgi:hypothetical protein
MRDDSPLRLGDAVRVTLASGLRPAEIALARAASGALWMAARTLDASDDSMLLLVRLRVAEPRLAIDDVRAVHRASRSGGIAALRDTVWLAFRDAGGRATLASMREHDAHVHVQVLGPCDEPPLVTSDEAHTLFCWLAESCSGKPLPEGIRPIAFAAPSDARDLVLAHGPGGAAMAFVRGRAVELVDHEGHSRFEPLSTRARAHAPAVAWVNDRWAAAWVSEDTGKLVMARARAGESSARVAEVWTALERPWASAPALVADASGAWIAWREERGPRAGVYVRRLDPDMRQIAREARVSDRAAIAAPGRVAMVSCGERSAALAWIELRDGAPEVWARTVAL